MGKKKRGKVKYPGLKKAYKSRTKHEYLDQDYINDLTPELKEYLSKFNDEFYGANLDFKNLENNLHNTPELKKDCTDRNNANNRCVYSVAKARNKIIDNTHSFTEINEAVNIHINNLEEKITDNNIEDILIEYIDSKKSEEKSD